MSLCLDFTVSGPRGPAQTLLQVGDEAGDGLSVGAAPDLPRFCQQGEAADLKIHRRRHSAAALRVFFFPRVSSFRIPVKGFFRLQLIFIFGEDLTVWF